MKLFYTGPVVNTEMLVVMLEKHGISATQEFVDLIEYLSTLKKAAK